MSSTFAFDEIGGITHQAGGWGRLGARGPAEWTYVILDNLNHHRGKTIRDWCEVNRVELVFTPTYASWANPNEAHFGPLRHFLLANSDDDGATPNAKPPKARERCRTEHRCA